MFVVFVIKYLAVLLMLTSSSFGVLSAKDNFTSFFWTQQNEDTLLYGCTGHLSIETQLSDKYKSVFWMTKYEWWTNMFPSAKIDLDINAIDSLPIAITKSAEHFKSTQWLTSVTRNNDTVQFYFPLLPQNIDYGRYDYFTIDVNDTMDLEFYGAGDSIMVGTFVHKEPDNRGAVNIIARNAIIVELTKSNSLRVKSVRFDSKHKKELDAYLKYDLASFKKNADWYGISMIDTTTPEPPEDPTKDTVYVFDTVTVVNTIVDTVTVKDTVVNNIINHDTIYVLNLDTIAIIDTVISYITVIDTQYLIDTITNTVSDTVFYVDSIVTNINGSMSIVDVLKLYFNELENRFERSIRDSDTTKTNDARKLIGIRDTKQMIFKNNGE